MIELIARMGKTLALLLPFLVLVWLNGKTNLKREYRSRQFPMPILSLFYCAAVLAFFGKISEWLVSLIDMLRIPLAALAVYTEATNTLMRLLGIIANALLSLLDKLSLVFLLCLVANFLLLLAHIFAKRVLVSVFKQVFKNNGLLYRTVAGLFYNYEQEIDRWVIKKQFGQARTYVKSFYFGGIAISALAVLVSAELLRMNLLASPFYPFFGIVILGEIYFFLNGLTLKEQQSLLSGEADDAARRVDYTLLRKALRKLFGDKLEAENTSFASPMENARSNDELISFMETSEQPAEEAYGLFMRGKLLEGLDIDQNYMLSGRDLLSGKSILFNNPFYYDLIPYVSYAMNRVLLQHKKVLIVLGRHETEKDIEAWCEQGFLSVNKVPALWRVGALSRQKQELDVGILSRSAVQDLALHEANSSFFSDVEFVMLIEPSRLVTTAQIGLNSIARYCMQGTRQITFCSTDKNCDGLVDALSHILMTSITEVSATNRAKGTSSYMCWQTDNDLWQHRLLPNITRNLGIGTELSLVALKNQVSRTDWYGGDVFPVLDAHWIAKQYYYELLRYAELPPSQDKLDEVFCVSPNLWNAKMEKYHYMTVEDEFFNLFEIRRTFATRAKVQGFINVISSDYLLREYMVQNEGIFNTDAKAIPYIVADYARTTRNVVLRLFLRMSIGAVPEAEICREFSLLDIVTDNLRHSLWHELYLCYSPNGGVLKIGDQEILECIVNGKRLTFTEALIQIKKKFSFQSGQLENCYYIDNPAFSETILYDLQNADFIAESDQEGRQYLGTELHGQVFQKYLPGQFFTFGGKHYEVLRMTKSGKVLIRRAADHIIGRPSYRQVRQYTLRNITNSSVMGDNVVIDGMRIARQFADIYVKTPGYWQLDSYQDFAHGKLTELSDIPERVYLNKQVLRIELPDADGTITPEIRHTLTVLFNEIFRTVFAENQGFIAAVGENDPELPLTYSLNADGVNTDNCIYIIEDSLLDIGLLEAVMRNLSKLFSIICDYLHWHQEALEKSLNPPPTPIPPDFTVDPSIAEEEAKKEPHTKIGRFFKKIFGGVKRFFVMIGRCFKKIFGKKQKPETEETKEPKMKRPKKEKKLRKEKRRKKGEPFETEGLQADKVGAIASTEDGEQAIQSVETEESEQAIQSIETEDSEQATQLVETEQEADVLGLQEPEDCVLTADSAEEENAEPLESQEEEEIESASEDGGAPPTVLAAISAPKMLFNELSTEGKEPQQGNETDISAAALPEQETNGTQEESEEILFEDDKAKKADSLLQRKPYHERYFLLYGGTEMPENLDLINTAAYLELLGFNGSELTQARKGTELAGLIEQDDDPNKAGGKYCDFCGAKLTGAEYEVLADGRERCNSCSRTAVKTAEEFKTLYHEVLWNMEAFFGIEIHAAIRVEMVNAKKLHKRLGKSFVPTGNADGRTLGVAIKDKNGYSLLVENGSPRLQAVMTMVHELTHIWQYLHWDAAKIARLYGKQQELEIYEGMAKWVEIQYVWLVNEAAAAMREEMITSARQDEYGVGFRKYLQRYPLRPGIHQLTGTPFDDLERPL